MTNKYIKNIMDNKDKKAYINFHVKEFLDNKGILYENPQEIHISMEQINELSGLFLDFLFIENRQFLGVDGWISWIYGCLLEKFIEASKKYNGVKISDIPELKELYKDIGEFEYFARKYLGGEIIDSVFKLNNKNDKNDKTIIKEGII